jgi:hypothetical protein
MFGISCDYRNVTQQACWTPSTHKDSARPGRTTAGYKNKLLSAADVFVLKSPRVHSAVNNKYGAKEQHGKAKFAPKEQECTYYQHLPVRQYKRNYLSSAPCFFSRMSTGNICSVKKNLYSD